jgi:hypothetical protein
MNKVSHPSQRGKIWISNDYAIKVSGRRPPTDQQWAGNRFLSISPANPRHKPIKRMMALYWPY